MLFEFRSFITVVISSRVGRSDKLQDSYIFGFDPARVRLVSCVILPVQAQHPSISQGFQQRCRVSLVEQTCQHLLDFGVAIFECWCIFSFSYRTTKTISSCSSVSDGRRADDSGLALLRMFSASTTVEHELLDVANMAVLFHLNACRTHLSTELNAIWEERISASHGELSRTIFPLTLRAGIPDVREARRPKTNCACLPSACRGTTKFTRARFCT